MSVIQIPLVTSCKFPFFGYCCLTISNIWLAIQCVGQSSPARFRARRGRKSEFRNVTWSFSQLNIQPIAFTNITVRRWRPRSGTPDPTSPGRPQPRSRPDVFDRIMPDLPRAGGTTTEFEDQLFISAQHHEEECEHGTWLSRLSPGSCCQCKGKTLHSM